MHQDNYQLKKSKFVEHLRSSWKNGTFINYNDSTIVYDTTGRKYDKICLTHNNESTVVFFIEKKSGTIYGARSELAPNKEWYYGTLDTFHLWDWDGLLPVPTRDTSVRLKKTYGPYNHYMKI